MSATSRPISAKTGTLKSDDLISRPGSAKPYNQKGISSVTINQSFSPYVLDLQQGQIKEKNYTGKEHFESFYKSKANQNLQIYLDSMTNSVVDNNTDR